MVERWVFAQETPLAIRLAGQFAQGLTDDLHCPAGIVIIGSA